MSIGGFGGFDDGGGRDTAEYSDSETIGVEGIGGSADFPGVEFTFTVAVTGNALTFTARTEGTIGISASDALGIGDSKTASVLVTPQLDRVQELARAIEGSSNIPGLDLSEQLRSAIQGAPQFDFGGVATGDFGDNLQSLRNVSSIPMNTAAEIRLPFIPTRTIGNDPEVESVNFNIQKLPVPDIPPVRNALDQLDPLVIEARLKSDSIIANALSNASGFTSTVEVELPVEAFLDFRELGGNFGQFADCLDSVANGDQLEADARDIAQRVGSIVTRIDSISDRFQRELRDQRDDAIDQLVDDIGEDLEALAESGQQAVDDAQQTKEDVEELVPTEEEIRQKIQEGGNLEDLVENPPSREEVRQRILQGGDVRELFRESIQRGRERRQERREDITGSENPFQDRMEEIFGEDLLSGATPNIASLGQVNTGGTLLPKGIIDESYLLDQVVCEGKTVQDIERERLLDFELGVEGGPAENFRENMFSVFASELSEFEAVAEQIRRLENDVEDAFGTGTECRFLFKDMVSNLRGCSSFSLSGGDLGVGGRIRLPRGDIQLPSGGLPAIAAGGNFPTLAEGFAVTMGYDVEKEEREEPETPSAGGVTVTPAPEPEPDRLTCADIRQEVRNRVNELEERSQRLQDKNPFELEFRKVVQLRNEIESVRNRIQSEVDSRNPCKGNLQGRLQRARSFLEDIRDVSFEDLPCTTRFDDLEDQVSQFERLAAQPSATIRELGRQQADLDELREEVGDDIDLEELVRSVGENEIQIRTADIVETIEEEAENECVKFFLNRVQQAEAELETAARGLQISRDLFSESRERRQEIVNQIRDNTTNREDIQASLQELLDRAGTIQQIGELGGSIEDLESIQEDTDSGEE